MNFHLQSAQIDSIPFLCSAASDEKSDGCSLKKCVVKLVMFLINCLSVFER